MPLSLTPPNGVRRSRTFWELTQHMPVSIACATRWARCRSLVHMYAASPYGVAFASRTASASSPNGMATSTGPKISSWKTLICSSTSAMTVASRKLPSGAVPVDDRRPSTRAPCLARRFDVAEHALVVLGPDQRAELGSRIERIPGPDFPRPVGHSRDDLLVERLLDEQPRSRRAALTVHGEDLGERRVDAELRVGVLEDDHRRLAAELDRGALERRRAGGDDRLRRSSSRP